MKQKIKKIFENAIWWSGVIMVGLILGISLQFVRAWTEPAVAPPGGNVGAPINTGANQQLKGDFLSHIGSLGLAGVLETFGFKMPTGAGVGKVLTSDATGIGTWQPPSGGGGAIACNSVNTFGPVNSWTGKNGYNSGGYGIISLLKGGRNICEDDAGCTYRIWKYSAAYPAGENAYANSPVSVRQIEDGRWLDAQGSSRGVNGNSDKENIVNWSSGMFRIWDDWPGVETSPDEWTWVDDQNNAAYFITICDY